ncbi:MAG: sensor histidine kinase, partial [Anaerolineae bacterium]
NLQRGVRLLDWSLWRLTELLPIIEMPQRQFGPLAGVMAKLRLLAERERPFTELREARTRQASEAAAQAERNRLARDLHDSIKQQLFTIQMGAATARARWQSDPEGAQAALAGVRAGAQAAMAEMNAMLQQLAPLPLEKIGLVEALREQCAALAFRTGAEVTTDFGLLPLDEQFPEGAQTAIFRLAQEALSNAARHARAQYIHLGLTADDTAVHLTIQDDGQGFDPTAGGEGMGLPNMRQRVAELGGEIEIESVAGSGTAVQVTIPIMESNTMKEKRLEKADYFLHRISLTGLVGGLLLVAIWYFPVYAVLPGNPVWENGTALLGWILTVVGLAVPGLSGFVAARRAGLATRRGNGLAGMFAGGLAAWVAYFGLVGAGTAVLGSLDIIEHGPTLSGREGTFLWLIVQGVMGVVNWSYGGMTAVILLGLFLGWLGGWLAPVAMILSERNWARQRDNLGGIGVAFTLSGLLTLVVTAFVYAPLGVEMRRAVDESVAAGFTITHSAAWADVLPVLVALAVYLTGLTAVFYLLRQNQQSDDA